MYDIFKWNKVFQFKRLQPTSSYLLLYIMNFVKAWLFFDIVKLNWNRGNDTQDKIKLW